MHDDIKNINDVEDTKDLTTFTCTDFMIQLKLLSKSLATGACAKIYCTREQLQNVPKSLMKPPFAFTSMQVEPNKHLLRFTRSE
ncbi:MAG: hypothetical protein GYA24_07860 [Candidatus Lokiarchaeota archaeon]|nr:hypothetical protein [Candidatus Lokiarchaeota archaeon]